MSKKIETGVDYRFSAILSLKMKNVTLFLRTSVRSMNCCLFLSDLKWQKC